jgi:hypothetical protein
LTDIHTWFGLTYSNYLVLDDPVPYYNRGRERLEPQLEALAG